MTNKKAQVSMEMMVILGVLILGAVIFSVLLINLLNKNVSSADELDTGYTNTIDSYLTDITKPPGTIDPPIIFDKFSLFLNKNPSAGGSVIGAGNYDPNESVTVTATENIGYNFVNWTSSLGFTSNNNSYTFNMPENDLTLTANYSIASYNLTVLKTGNGIVTSNVGDINCGTTCSDTYDYDTLVILTAIPDTGSTFEGWSGACSGTSTTCEVTMDEAKTVTANFLSTDCTLFLNTNPEGGGTVSGAGTYDCGTEVTVSTTSNTGYNFLNWTNSSDVIVSSNSTYSFTLTTNTTLTANFDESYILTLYKSPVHAGTVNGAGSYDPNESVTITATTNTGYEFIGWTNSSGNIVSENLEYSFSMPSENMTLTANFLLDPGMFENSFKTKWDTRNTNDNSSASNQIKLPLYNAGNYDFIVDWGDGTTDYITYNYNNPKVLHTYDVSGVYNIEIIGVIEGFRFNNTGDKLKLLEISEWGPLNLDAYGNYFYGAENLKITATDIPNLESISYSGLSGMFRNCYSLTNIPNINSWNISNISDLSYMFYNTPFNQDISSWNVSNVEDMSYLFYKTPFNQDISSWNVSNVTNMSYLFYNTPFNQPLDNWNVSNVTNMALIFYNTPFNQPLNSWNVSNVTNMYGMFYKATSFNQPLNNWNVSNVTNMNSMFIGSPVLPPTNYSAFNQDISMWDVSSVTTMQSMFAHTNFNHPLNSWNVSNVGRMDYMFNDAHAFNQPLDSWDVSNVGRMSGMFKNTSFNQDISSWNVSNVVSMWEMFKNTPFNQDISSWDISSVYSMAGMFSGASSFNKDLSSWDVSSATSLRDFFAGAISFNQPLNSWNVSSVNDMQGMFDGASSFNQDLSSWNTSNVRDMDWMFRNANSFDQDLSSWNFESLIFKERIWNVQVSSGMDKMFEGVTLSTTNYDALLISFANQSMDTDFIFSGGNSKYSSAAQAARDILIGSPNNWSISDGGLAS